MHKMLLLITMAAIAFPSCGVKDSTISEAITQKSQSMPELGQIRASVANGVVTLSGEVKDDATRTSVEEAVKSIKGVRSVINNCTITPPPPPPPVAVSQDDVLSRGVADATKDFPGVKANVKDGVITLTGEIKRSSLPTLMKSLNALNPKKIQNQLTIK
ncbi:MAG: transport-associated protein [Bacteroidetes bacterium]|nr:MAG: transport-associated protein [Bacteroidota bacterium]